MMQKLDLDEKQHALSTLQRLDRMKRDQQHCDFIVSVSGNEFHTHRNILSAGSDYFNAMFAHNTKESQLGKVEMIDADPECVGICLNYIYTGKAEIPEGKSEQLIHISALMQLNKLNNAVAQHLKKSLDTSTFYSTRKIAETYDLQNLLATCRTFERQNILSLSSEDDFQNEQMQHIVEILNSVSLPEQEKLNLSLQWAGDSANKKSNLLKILKCIQLEEVSDKYLHHILENNTLIKNDLDLYKTFNGPLIRRLVACCTSRDDSYMVRSLILFDNTSDSFLYLNPITNHVEKFLGEKFVEFGRFSAISLHSYIYALCIDKSVHRLSFLNKNAKWEKMQDMIECHGSFPPSVSLNGFLYVMGGHYNQLSSAAERFCPGENLWVRLKNMPIAIGKAVLVTLGGFIYSIGGETEQAAINAFYKFNLLSAEWTELEPMRQAKCDCGAVAVNQKIYVMGGTVGEDNGLWDMDCYDVTLKQWTTLSPMIGSHFMINAHHVCGWIFAVERFSTSEEIQKYDIEKDEWQSVELIGTDEFQIFDSVLI